MQVAAVVLVRCVVPLVGTWIEINILLVESVHIVVVPLVGTWIEIPTTLISLPKKQGRSPRGNVD